MNEALLLVGGSDRVPEVRHEVAAVGSVMVEETVQVTPDGGRHLFEPLPSGLALPGA